jgi:hypothetical protein
MGKAVQVRWLTLEKTDINVFLEERIITKIFVLGGLGFGEKF